MASLSSNIKTLISLTHIHANELARRTGIIQPTCIDYRLGQNTNSILATIKLYRALLFMVNVSQLIVNGYLTTNRYCV